MWFNFEFYKLKAYILLRQALNLFFKGVADGRMGFERHNEFAVRFKFRVLETCTTGHIPQIFHLGTAMYLFTQFCCTAKLQRTGGGKSGFYSLLLLSRRLKFSLGETCIETSFKSHLPVMSFILRSTVRSPLESNSFIHFNFLGFYTRYL